MSEKMERDVPVDIFVLQPAKPPEPGGKVDPNYTAQFKTWNDGEHWTVIHTVVDFVQHVKVTCGDRKFVRVLRIGGHGSKDSFRLGEALISIPVLDTYQVWLREVTPFLIPGKSLICLDHCTVGNNDELLKKFSQIFGGVPVIAPLELQGNEEGAPELEGPGRICNRQTCVTTYSPNDKPSDLLALLALYEAISGLVLPDKNNGIWNNLPKN